MTRERSSAPGVEISQAPEPAEEFQLADAPGFLFRRLDSLASYLFYQNSGQTEISPRQFGILLTLHETGPISQGELSDLMHIDRSTMGEIIRRMSVRGLVKRSKPGNDRRRIEIMLTRPGSKALLNTFPAAVKVQEELLSTIPVEERATVLAYLTAVLDKFGL
jgi:DNA-binding MarR family transcriptional regulator